MLQTQLTVVDIFRFGVFSRNRGTEEAFRRWAADAFGLSENIVQGSVRFAVLVETWDAARQRVDREVWVAPE